MTPIKCLALVLCVLIPESPGYAAPPCRPVGKGINFYSRAREIELGKELARDVEREARIIEDPVVSEYVNRIGQNLVNQSGAGYVFVIKVVRSEEVNTYALPGGFLFVNSGLIRAAENEAELAVALAHEIGHVAARHYTRQASWGDILNYASIPMLFMGGWPGLVAREGLAFGTPLALKKFSRAFEAEADTLGIRYVDSAGYDPTALVDFLERIARTDKGSRGLFAKMLSAHPPIASRVRAAQKQIQRELSPRPQYLIQTSEFVLVKERLAAIENGQHVPRRSTSTVSDPPPVLRRAKTSPDE